MLILEPEGELGGSLSSSISMRSTSSRGERCGGNECRVRAGKLIGSLSEFPGGDVEKVLVVINSEEL